MKLSTATALATFIAIAIQRHSHRVMCASAGDHERKLLIDQDEAAKRVNDIVKLTMASVDAGDVNGVVLPLNYVRLSGIYGGSQQLAAALRLAGVDRDQHVLVDTGSSSLAFCNESLAEEAINITKTDYAQCKAYNNQYTCSDDPSVASVYTFYVGQVFKGNIAAYDMSNGKEIASMDDVNFAIMSDQQNYFCLGPLDGIIGVAYTANNIVAKTPSPDFDVLNLWNQTCETGDSYYKSAGRCNSGNMTKIPLPSPLEQSLQEGVDSGYDSVEAFGLYCDYAATNGSKTDTIVPSLGIYFGGDVALNNTFYNSGTPQVALIPWRYHGNLGIDYSLVLNSIRVPGLNNNTYSGFNQCYDQPHRCFTDSGDSSISLPLPQSVCNELLSTDPDTVKEMGWLLLDLKGVNRSNITLSLPLHWLVALGRSGFGKCGTADTSGKFVLGFPIYQYYYLVYDMGNNTVTFVDLPQTNENVAFIDGPELGGANEPSSTKEPSTSSEPSTGYRHNGSPSITNTFVMAGAGLFMLACKYIF